MFENVETLDAILQLPNPEILLNQMKFNIGEMRLHCDAPLTPTDK